MSRGASGWVTTTFGTNSRERLGVSFAVLVDVDDDVRRRELADPVDLHVLRPPHLRDRRAPSPTGGCRSRCARRAAAQAEVAEQLGDARDEADDARVAAGDGMLGADRVDERHYMLRRYSPPDLVERAAEIWPSEATLTASISASKTLPRARATSRSRAQRRAGARPRGAPGRRARRRSGRPSPRRSSASARSPRPARRALRRQEGVDADRAAACRRA